MRITEYPKEWIEVAQQILGRGKIVVVLGGVDTGKTTLVTFLANYLWEKGKKVAVIDTDVGQQDLGPPTTIGLGVLNNSIQHIREIERVSFYFVGAITPEKHLLPIIAGIKRLLDKAKELAEIILIDTTGLISGKIGVVLKEYKLEMVRPDYILMLPKKDELEPLVAIFRKFKGINLISLPIPRGIKVKTKEERRLNREKGFQQYFLGSKNWEVKWEIFSFRNFFLRRQRELTKVEYQFLEGNLNCLVEYGEKNSESLYLVISGEEDVEREFLLRRYFHTENIYFYPKEILKNRLVGLMDEEGNYKGLGIIKKIFFIPERTMVLYSPLKDLREIVSLDISSYTLEVELKGENYE